MCHAQVKLSYSLSSHQVRDCRCCEDTRHQTNLESLSNDLRGMYQMLTVVLYQELYTKVS